jgi:hypothetical protein
MEIPIVDFLGEPFIFYTPYGSIRYASQIISWASIRGLVVDFHYFRIGQLWLASPWSECMLIHFTHTMHDIDPMEYLILVSGNVLTFEYYGFGINKRAAKEECCRKMAESGACVSGFSSYALMSC